MRRNWGFAVSMVYPIMKAIRDKGLDFDQFCRQACFDSRLLQDVEARIDDEDMERVMKEAAQFTRDDHFGLHKGRLTDVADLGVLGYILMHSATIADALGAYRRYHIILCSGSNLDWEERGNTVRLRFFRQNGGKMSRHCLEDMVSSIYHMIVRLCHRKVAVRELCFTHEAPADTAPYLSVFGVLPRFGEKEAILEVDQEVWQAPILYANRKLRNTFETIAEETKHRLMLGKVFSDRIFQWLMECMPKQFPTLRQTADSFGMSERTLQLKLKGEGTSYSELAAAVRKELACSYLARGEFSIAEIAYLLHFSEPSAFHSAFKKWTGMTPGQYRERELQKTG